MSTDRTNVFTGPCLCGSGTIEVDHCSPDHGWPVATPFWYEFRLQCDECRKVYELVKQGAQIVLVKKSDIEQRDNTRSTARQERDKFMETEIVQNVLDELVSALDDLPSMAAAHRLLAKHRLFYESIGTFRKGWNGGAHWVARHVSYYNLPNVLTLLGQENAELENAVAAISENLADADKDLPIVGKPIYTTAD